MTKLPTCLEQGHWGTGNLVITPIELKGESVVLPHSHKHGHNMFFLQGRTLVKTTDPTCGCKREVIFEAFSHCWIPAGIEHEAVALDGDSKAICVFHREEFGGQIDKEINGWGELGMFEIEKPKD